MKKLLFVVSLLYVFFGNSQCPWKSQLEIDLYRDDNVKMVDLFYQSDKSTNHRNEKAYEILHNEAYDLRTDVQVIQIVANNIDEINQEGGLNNWKKKYNISDDIVSSFENGTSLAKGVNSQGSLNFNQVIKTNLEKIGIFYDETKFFIAPNSKGGAYILQGVNLEAKEITLADEVFNLTNQRCVFPKTDLQAVEGFLENGSPFTMKELEKDFNNFIPLINQMSSKIKDDPNFQWIGAEGYLKVPFNSFRKKDGTIQTVTKQYVEQQFNAGIGRNAFKIKNDGTVKNITVFLKDGSNFKLDLSKLNP